MSSRTQATISILAIGLLASVSRADDSAASRSSVRWGAAPVRFLEIPLSETSLVAPESQWLLTVSPTQTLRRDELSDPARNSLGGRMNDENSVQRLQMEVEYGVASNLSLALSSSFSQRESVQSSDGVATTFRSRGFTDPEMALKGYQPLAPNARLVYSVFGSFSPENARIAARSFEGNQFSGRNSLGARVGFEGELVGRTTTGAVVSYRAFSERSWDVGDGASGLERQRNGGNELVASAYAETRLARVRAGLSARVHLTEASSSRAPLEATFANGASSSFGAGAFALFRVMNVLELRPSVDVTSLLSSETQGLAIDRSTAVAAQISARMAL